MSSIALCASRGAVIIRAMLFTVALLSTVGGQLINLQNTTAPFTSGIVEQMAFDYVNQTLYFAARDRSIVIGINKINVDVVAWNYAIVAGKLSTSGLPSESEQLPTDASFRYPNGVIGWPRYAIEAMPRDATSGFANSWAGLWVVDAVLHNIRFVNFVRGNNVTLVGGNSSGAQGDVDGFGRFASINGPHNVVWGRFPADIVTQEVGMGSSASNGAQWTSVVLWSEYQGHCIRQGVPMYNRTDGPPRFLVNSTASLETMVLNVSVFGGLCGTFGSGAGFFYRRPILTHPLGIVVVNPFVALSASPFGRMDVPDDGAIIAFITEDWAVRLSMVSPMFPSSSRFLTVVRSFAAMIGIWVGRVLPMSKFPGAGGSILGGVELVVGLNDNRNLNISISLSMNPLHRTVKAKTNSLQVFAYTNFAYTRNAIFIRYTPNSSYTGTLVLLSGFYCNFQYYCCLDPEYSEPVSVTSNSHFGTPTATISVSSSLSASVSIPSMSTSRSVVRSRSGSPSSSWSASPSPTWTLTPTPHPTASVSPSYSISPLASISQSSSFSSTPTMSYLSASTSMNRTASAALPVPVPDALSTAQRVGVGTAAAAASFSTGGTIATALATMGLAERCLIPLQNESDRPLAFPATFVPWGIGESAEYPRLPYYRAAAVESLIGHTIVAAVGAVAALVMAKTGLTTRRPRWYVNVLLRLPLSSFLMIDGLMLDAGVGGGATAVQAGGASELGYLVCGLLGPVLTIAAVTALAWTRSSSYDPEWLINNAALKKRQVLAAKRRTPAGLLHRYVVGVGAWRGVEGVALLALSAYGKYRGPGVGDTTALSRACPYFFVAVTGANVIISGSRAAATVHSCVLPCVMVAALCTLVAVLFTVLRPMTSVIKNIVGIVLAVYAAINAWLLLIAAIHGAPYLFQAALAMAEGQAYLGATTMSIFVLSLLLSQWVARATKNGVEGRSGGGAGPTDGMDALLMQPEDDIDDDGAGMGGDISDGSESMSNFDLKRRSTTAVATKQPHVNVIDTLLESDDDDDDCGPSTGGIVGEGVGGDPAPAAPVTEVNPMDPPPPSVHPDRPAMPLSQLADLRSAQ